MFRQVIAAAALLLVSQGRPPDIAFQDSRDRSGRQRDGRRRRHQPRRPARHRVRRVLVSGAVLDEAPVPRDRLHEQLHRQLQRHADRRRRRRLSRHRRRLVVRAEDRVVEEPGHARASAGLWKEAEINSGVNVEFAVLADIDNDGKAREVVAQQNGTPQAWYEVQERRVGQARRERPELRPRHRRRRRQQRRPQRHPDAARLARSAGRSARRRQLDVSRRLGSDQHAASGRPSRSPAAASADASPSSASCTCST